MVDRLEIVLTSFCWQELGKDAMETEPKGRKRVKPRPRHQTYGFSFVGHSIASPPIEQNECTDTGEILFRRNYLRASHALFLARQSLTRLPGPSGCVG